MNSVNKNDLLPFLKLKYKLDNIDRIEKDKKEFYHINLSNGNNRIELEIDAEKAKKFSLLLSKEIEEKKITEKPEKKLSDILENAITELKIDVTQTPHNIISDFNKIVQFEVDYILTLIKKEKLFEKKERKKFLAYVFAFQKHLKLEKLSKYAKGKSKKEIISSLQLLNQENIKKSYML